MPITWGSKEKNSGQQLILAFKQIVDVKADRAKGITEPIGTYISTFMRQYALPLKAKFFFAYILKCIYFVFSH